MSNQRSFMELAQQAAAENIAVARAILEDGALLNSLEAVAGEMTRALRAGGKALLFGNGGSAADAQHIAAELVGRFKRERRGLPAIALTVNTSSLTAIANDLGFERVFGRQIEALGRSGDLAIGISTSGNSPSVLRAIEAANLAGLITVGMTGRAGGDLKSSVQYCLQAPSDDTPRIQEAHILMGHILCEYVEESLCAGTKKSDE